MDEVAEARAALDRFASHYPSRPPPVDVEEIAGSLCRLRVRQSGDLADVPGAPGGAALSGLLLPTRWEIWVCTHEPWARRRFSVAHEIGHFLLHVGAGREDVFCRAGDLRPDPESPDRLRERQANRFAAELLMPEALVGREVARVGPDPFALARLFAVSDVAMGFRLVNLGHLRELPLDLDTAWRAWQP